MKRVLLFVFSGIAALIAMGLFFGGLALALVFGGDGWVNSSNKRVSSDSYALISEPADINNGFDSDNDWFDVSVRIRAEPASTDGSGGEVFVGVAETVDVDRYLAGVSHDVVTDLDWGQSGVSLAFVPGSDTPEPPVEQDFWVESASGPGEQELVWDLENGSFRLVIMNADGSQSIDVRSKFGFKVPFLFGLGVAFLIASVVIGFVAVLLLVLGIRARPTPAPAGPPPTAWGGSPGAPATPGDAPSAGWATPPDRRDQSP